MSDIHEAIDGLAYEYSWPLGGLGHRADTSLFRKPWTCPVCKERGWNIAYGRSGPRIQDCFACEARKAEATRRETAKEQALDRFAAEAGRRARRMR